MCIPEWSCCRKSSTKWHLVYPTIYGLSIYRVSFVIHPRWLARSSSINRSRSVDQYQFPTKDTSVGYWCYIWCFLKKSAHRMVSAWWNATFWHNPSMWRFLSCTASALFPSRAVPVRKTVQNKFVTLKNIHTMLRWMALSTSSPIRTPRVFPTVSAQIDVAWTRYSQVGPSGLVNDPNIIHNMGGKRFFCNTLIRS